MRKKKIYCCAALHEIFESRVEKTATCWLWRGARNGHGYGRWILGSLVCGSGMVHRYSFYYHGGTFEPGKCLDHICRIRVCVNPAHLRQVTPSQNTLIGLSPSALNARKVTCSKCSGPYTQKKHHRVCVPCENARDRARYVAKPLPTNCRKCGTPYTQVTSDHRRCVTCRRENVQKRYAKRLEQKTPKNEQI